MTTQLAAAITYWALHLHIPEELLLALVEVESSGQPCAIRFEPGYRWLWDLDANEPYRAQPDDVGLPSMRGSTRATEMAGQRFSWGPLQIMGATSRELGFRGWFPQLCGEPGIEYGARYLRRLYDRYHNWEDAVAAYNAGRADKVRGKYRNQAYVDKVKRKWFGSAG